MDPAAASGALRAGGAAARAAVIAWNMRSSLAALVRPPLAARPAPAGRYARRALAVAGAVALAMLALDAPLHEMASALPLWAIGAAYRVTDLGLSGWILIPVGAVLIAMALVASPALDYMSRAVLAMVAARLGYVFIAVGLPGLVVTVVKRGIGRVRPSAEGPFAYLPFSWRPDYASFPSGHTTTAFAALVALGALWPRLRPALWIYALAIAASRVAVSAHYLSDVMAGAACGVAGALLVRDWFAARRLGFHAGPGGVRAMAGPSLRRIIRVAAGLVAP